MELFRKPNQEESLPLLRIFALGEASVDKTIRVRNMLPVNVFGLSVAKEEKTATCVIPTIARDGHVSLILAGTQDDFCKIQEDISTRFTKNFNELHLTDIYLANFLVIGFTLAFAEDPNKVFLVYETSISPVPIPELLDIYIHLKSVSDLNSTIELESYFADSLRKKWLNEFIIGLENTLDWPEFVAKSIKRIKNQ